MAHNCQIGKAYTDYFTIKLFKTHLNGPNMSTYECVFGGMSSHNNCAVIACILVQNIKNGSQL